MAEEPEREAKRIKLAEPDDLDEKINKQIEYYFSDVNVVKDKFLQEEFKKDDGWVKLSVLLTFVRLQQLTKDESRIMEAIKDNKSEIFEVDESKKALRRKNPMPDPAEFQKQLDLRTVHVSGFPTNYEFEELKRYCAQYGEVESMSMRRHFKTRFFKGCIHVVYKKEEDAKKILAEEVLKCKDRELKKESMEDYHKRKADMAKAKAEKRKSKSNKKPTVETSIPKAALISLILFSSLLFVMIPNQAEAGFTSYLPSLSSLNPYSWLRRNATISTVNNNTNSINVTVPKITDRVDNQPLNIITTTTTSAPSTVFQQGSIRDMFTTTRPNTKFQIKKKGKLYDAPSNLSFSNHNNQSSRAFDSVAPEV